MDNEFSVTVFFPFKQAVLLLVIVLEGISDHLVENQILMPLYSDGDIVQDIMLWSCLTVAL